MNNVVGLLETSLKKEEFRDFLEGKGMYNIPNREGFMTDRAIALYSGIYEYYKMHPEKEINKIFEKELIDMLHSDEFDVMCAFDYCWRQIVCEERKTAPFKLSEECLLNIKSSISSKKDILSNYKDYVEFGSMLNDGAFEYAHNIDMMLDEDYGRKIL